MLIEASWPSNSEAAVTKRTLLARAGWSASASLAAGVIVHVWVERPLLKILPRGA